MLQFNYNASHNITTVFVPGDLADALNALSNYCHPLAEHGALTAMRQCHKYGVVFYSTWVDNITKYLGDVIGHHLDVFTVDVGRTLIRVLEVLCAAEKATGHHMPGYMFG